MMSQTGKYIRQKRTEKGVTKEALAQAAKVSVSQVEKWEDEQQVPGLLQLEPICSLLGCSVTQLVLGDDAANTDALILELLRKIEHYKGLGIAAFGLLLAQLPFPAHIAVAGNAGEFLSGFVQGASGGCSLIGVCFFARGIAMCIINRQNNKKE